MPKGPNVGDNIIDLATKKILKSVFKDAEIFSYRSHKHAAFFHGKINIGDRDLLAGIGEGSLEFHRKPDLIVIGGAPAWATSTLVSMDPEAINRYSVPVVFLGAGSKYYPNPDNRQRFISAVEKIKDIIMLASARDEPTYRDMRQMGIRAYMTGCPVMHYIGDEIHFKDSDYFIISFRDSKDLKKIQITKKFVSKLEDVIGAKHLIVFHDYREVKLAQKWKGDIRYIVEYNPENLIPFYKNAKFVLSYRLHGTLLSTTCGTPFLQIANDGRCNDFVQTFDPEWKYNIAHSNLTEDDILNRIRKIFQSKQIYDYEDYNKKIINARQNLEKFKNELKRLIR